MGVVLAAYDPELDRKIALKILRREILSRAAGAKLRLMREAQAMARVSHPNVLAVHDVGAIGDGLFIAMEYVDGATFAGWLAQAKRSWRESLALLEQAGRGWRRRTRRGWCTGISSPRMSSWPGTGASASPTSAWRARSTRRLLARTRTRTRGARTSPRRR